MSLFLYIFSNIFFSILYFLSLFCNFFFERPCLRSSSLHHERHHGGHHCVRVLCTPCNPALWMLISAVLARAIKTEFALYVRVEVYALLPIGASWEVLALLCWVHKRTFFVGAIREVLAFDVFFANFRGLWFPLKLLPEVDFLRGLKPLCAILLLGIRRQS